MPTQRLPVLGYESQREAPSLPLRRRPSDYDKSALPQFMLRRLRWAFGERRPLVGYLKVTERCNMDCYYCPWHTEANDFTNELSTAAWEEILADLAERGLKLAVFEGGEPTLRSDLQRLLDFAHSLGMHTVVATNGTYPLQRHVPSAFTVSVDGSEALHDSIRGKGSYRRLVQHLEERPEQNVTAITVLTRNNFGLIEEICEDLEDLVDGFLFTFLYPYKTAGLEVLDADEIALTKRRLLALKKRYRLLNPSSYLKKPMHTKPCHDRLSVSVNSAGHVHEGCFVELSEPKDCSKCELSCFQVLSAFHDFNFEAWFNLYRILLRPA